jgi:peptidyl-prolyl cis-trans isomerase SurA
MTAKFRRALLFALIGLALAAAAGAQQVIEEIVAVVNDDVITLSDYRREYDARVQMLRSQFQGDEYEKQYQAMKAELLDGMITETLLLQLAREKQLNVSEQLKQQIDYVKKQNNLETDEDLRRALARQGLEWESWRKQFEETLLQQAVIYTEVERSISVEDSEVVAYYKDHKAEFIEPEEYKLGGMYVSGEDRTPEDVEARKTDILAKLDAGEDWGAVAAEASDPPTKDTKGDLGTFKKGELEKSLETAVAGLKVGERTPWLSIKNGWYLLRLAEKKDSRQLSFEEARKSIEEKIYNERRQKKTDAFLKDLRDKSYVKILIPDPIGR